MKEIARKIFYRIFKIDPTFHQKLRQTKHKYKIKITFVLTIIIFCLIFSFLPLNTLFPNNNIEIIVKVISSPILAFLVRFPLFATDPLATGRSKRSKYFKDYYPSKEIIKKYNVSNGQANKLWFSFFNSWGNPKSNYNLQWETMFERTYACRFIYYCTNLLLLSFIISVSLLSFYYLSNIYLKTEYRINIYNCGYTIISLGSLLFLFLSNRVPRKDKEASGCWYKYKEISEIAISILVDDILNKAATIEEANTLINQKIVLP
jgi:hypothetical protein